jgi:hypothetical protein
MWRVPHGRPFGYLNRGLSRGAFLWRCAVRVNTCASRLIARPTRTLLRMPERWERKTHAPGAPRGHSGTQTATKRVLDNIVCTTGQLKLPFLLSTFSIDLSTVETARGVTFLQVFASPAQNSAARNLRRRISQTPFKRESWLHLAGAEMCWLQLFGLRTKTDTRSIDRAWCCGASHWRGCS